MKYELWIDGIWQDTFNTHEMAAFAIGRWLMKHASYVTQVTFKIKIIDIE